MLQNCAPVQHLNTAQPLGAGHEEKDEKQRTGPRKTIRHNTTGRPISHTESRTEVWFRVRVGVRVGVGVGVRVRVRVKVRVRVIHKTSRKREGA
jgi:hypothetical protein